MSERRPTAKLREHPDAHRIPAMSSEEYEGFLADVAERGLQVPLEVTRAGIVLDGRHRLRAVRELGLPSAPVRIVSPKDELLHMFSAALQRRHLSQSQKAALIVELAEYQEARAQAEQRQRANLRGAAEVATLTPRSERKRELAARWGGVGARTLQDALTVHEADPALFEAIKDGTLPASRAALEVRRAQRYAEIGPAPDLPADSFEVIYADPPWQLGNPHAPYAPENYYPTMPLEDIKAIGVPAAEDACLFLWAVNSLLPEALEVMAAWGFEFKTHFCWVKDSIGMGVWARNRHELLLFGIRGRFSPPKPRNRCDSVIEAKRGRHSGKPEDVYEWIERMYPHASKLELFARGRPRPGWTPWGNEVEAA
jgi:N6-adenosine-specific RNA methylase IME4